MIYFFYSELYDIYIVYTLPSSEKKKENYGYIFVLAPYLYVSCSAPAQQALRMGFHHNLTDTSLFIYHHGADTTYLLLYVDDIVLNTSSTSLLESIISHLRCEFSMTDLGALNYFLGILVTRAS